MTEKPVFTTEGLKDEEATLLGCLWARAAESTHQEAILHDPKAVELVESLDFDFDKIEKADYRPAEICIRATLVDSLVRRFLERHPDGTVVDIGAGLDTRFDRLDNGRVTWFELDLPNVIDLRRKFFDETPRRKFLSTSVMEEDWYETVREHGGTESILFVAEGVLYFVGEKTSEHCSRNWGVIFPAHRSCLTASRRCLCGTHTGACADSRRRKFSGVSRTCGTSSRGTSGSRWKAISSLEIVPITIL